MTPEIEDALYSACQVTTKSAHLGRMHVGNHPRAQGTCRGHPASIKEFAAKLKTFLGELDAHATVGELLDELREGGPM